MHALQTSESEVERDFLAGEIDQRVFVGNQSCHKYASKTFMVTVFLTTKKNVIHSFSLEKDDDFVYALDKLLKKHKLALSDCKKLSVSCAQEESMLCRIVTASAAAISSRF